MKNIKFDRKKVGSLLLAFGIMVSPCLSSADITSYAGMNTKLTDGRDIILFYSNEHNKSLISLNGQLGFIDNQYIADMYFDTNDYFSEVNTDDYIRVYSAPIYNNIDTKEVIGNLSYGTKVHIYSKTMDGYYVVYASDMIGFIEEASLIENTYSEPIVETSNPNLISVTKITGNNVNVRSEPKKGNNVIGFCDITDKFIILSHVNGYCEVEYLGQIGYISEKYVEEQQIDRNDIEFSKMVYLPNSAAFYDEDGNLLCYLPQYQNLQVISLKDDYYKVMVDGVIGYTKKKDTKSLTKTCIVVDLSRQILKVYKNGKEVFRCKVITGAKGMETRLGCYPIGHHIPGFTFADSDIYNEYWMQFDKNRGIHPADANAGKGWQKPEYFDRAVEDAYKNWAKGKGKHYPSSHGSHGCVNTMIKDTAVIYSLCEKGDNVLIIEQNDLIKNKLISNNNTNTNKVFVKFFI